MEEQALTYEVTFEDTFSKAKKKFNISLTEKEAKNFGEAVLKKTVVHSEFKHNIRWNYIIHSIKRIPEAEKVIE